MVPLNSLRGVVEMSTGALADDSLSEAELQGSKNGKAKSTLVNSLHDEQGGSLHSL